MIKNLKEFLAWRGCGDDPYQWARAYYKYMDCGPWVNFLQLVTPARDVDHPAVIAILRRVRGKVKLMNPQDVDPSYLQLLSLDEQGLPTKERTWDVYCGLVATYVADEAKQARTKKTLEIVKQTPTELHLRQPARTQHIEAEIREVYYEDLARQKSEIVTEKCGCTSEVCGSHPDDPQEELYRDCDPDPDCEICHGKGTHQRRRSTGEREATLDLDKCVGIEFGSIVEGSDVCSGPFTHMFPFTKTAWARDEKWMEQETSFYWKRDNATWYAVRTYDNEWIVADVWGDIEWQGKPPPKKIRAAAEAAIKGDWKDDPNFEGAIKQTIPHMPSMWRTPKESDKDWAAMPLGKTGAEIYTFDNDTTFE